MTHPTPNFASKVIQPEKVELNTDYTITINPCDSRQYWNQKDRIECVSRDMALIIGQVSADWTVYLETSSVGRLHWHGNILPNVFICERILCESYSQNNVDE